MSVNVTVEVWGDGGSGGDTGSSRASGGGGGGYAKLNAFAVTSGVSYDTFIPFQASGGNTYFNSEATVSASSGGFGTIGGTNVVTPGGAGGAGLVGDVLHTGGAGGDANANISGAGGGGAAGRAGNGTAGVSTSGSGSTAGGAGADSPAGDGGAGGRNTGAVSGTTPGGGGGGSSGTGHVAAGGAVGQVVISAPLGVIASAVGGTHTTDATKDYWTFDVSGSIFSWTPTLAASNLGNFFLFL